MVNYTVDAFVAAYILRLFPKFMRPFASRFIPQCRKLRNELDEARRIIDPVVESREKRNVPLDLPPNAAVEDGFSWLEQCANGRVYDPVIAQLSLSVVAIHTTSDMLTQVLFDLAERPELISALREEIVHVFGNDWVDLTRGSLQQLKLMDSVLKESQRMKPVNIGMFISLSTPRLGSALTNMPYPSLNPSSSKLQHQALKRDADPQRHHDLRLKPLDVGSRHLQEPREIRPI
ncbi:uncharacterized protein LDX57_002721 [Aspergillus melleus]|uniref:uncharacterized protein n=1 Tax=Aspergillus melleus TaxID=138277 RepID=UPI001E8D81C4|nr:uncharacterized protein LDX57_002721 [Aspergillus melleus]KAH8424975.1 hypothetical protein LDX57_002721 [Aspergillus melleus]